MPEPIIDPPDKADAAPPIFDTGGSDVPPSVFDTGGSDVPFPGTQAGVMQPSPTLKPAANSIDDILMPTPEQYQAANKDITDLTERKIGLEGAMAAEQSRHDREYSTRMNRMIAAEGATMDDIKPWNADAESAKYSTNLWDKFGSPGFVIAMVASAFTAQPMNSALNAGAAAMNAINQGDFAAYHRAFDTWKQNTSLALKRIDLETTQFNQIDSLRKSDMASWHAQMEALLSRFNDSRKLALLRNGMNSELIEAFDSQIKAREHLSTATMDIQKNDIRVKTFNGFLGDSRDPQKIAQAALFADQVMSEPKTPEQIAVKNVITTPGFFDLPSEQQNKKIMDAVRGLSEARYGGRGANTPLYQEVQRRNTAWDAGHPGAPDDERNAAYDQNMREVMTASKPIENVKAQETQRHNQVVEDVRSGQLTVQQAREQETERHNKINEDIANGKLEGQLTVEEEKERHNKAMEEISKVKGTQITPNKLAELEVMSQRYTSANDLIGKILKTLGKYTGAVGAAGYATRSAESISNLLGSHATDRRQIETWLAELQVLTPRLLTESAGRPLSSEAHKVDLIVRGKSFGDTKANTTRDLVDLKEQFQKIQSGLKNIMDGKKPADETPPAPAAPPADWSTFGIQ